MPFVERKPSFMLKNPVTFLVTRYSTFRINRLLKCKLSRARTFSIWKQSVSCPITVLINCCFFISNGTNVFGRSTFLFFRKGVCKSMSCGADSSFNKRRTRLSNIYYYYVLLLLFHIQGKSIQQVNGESLTTSIFTTWWWCTSIFYLLQPDTLPIWFWQVHYDFS